MRVLQSDAPSETSLNDAINDVAVVAEFICLSNKDGFCMQQLRSVRTPVGCENDSQNFFSDRPTCSQTCATSVKDTYNKLGCCAGVFSILQQATDPFYNELPNYAGISTSCNVTFAEACNPYSSEPVPVQTKVSGTCEWLLSNASNVDLLRNGTAKSLGVNPQSLRNFTVQGADGRPCKVSRNLKHRRAARTLQASAGLVANFGVVARDNTTAARIATSANSSKPITIPSVQLAATQTAATQKNAQLARNVTNVTSTPAPTLPTPLTQTPTPTRTGSPRPNVTASIAPSGAASMIPSVLLALLAVLAF